MAQRNGISNVMLLLESCRTSLQTSEKHQYLQFFGVEHISITENR